MTLNFHVPFFADFSELWPSEWQSDIHWLGSRQNKEIGVVHLGYGIEVTQYRYYSTAAILIKVPSMESEERKVLVSGGF